MENTEVRLMEKYIRVLALQTILYGTHSERPILCSVLLKPDFAGDLITGLLHAYDEGGWLPKWPNPGYTNCMMGTHSDAIIADAYVKGVQL